jgi:hypothetical protein
VVGEPATTATKGATLMEELIARLHDAAYELTRMSVDNKAEWEYQRLKGKVEGIRLAISYLREANVRVSDDSA